MYSCHCLDFNVRTDVDACNCALRMYRHHNRVCAGRWLWGSNPHQYYTWLFSQDTLPTELSPPLKLLSCFPINDPPTKDHFSINFKTTATLALLLCWSGKRALPPNCSAVRCSQRHTCSVRCLLISRPQPHLLRYYVDLERGLSHHTITIIHLLQLQRSRM